MSLQRVVGRLLQLRVRHIVQRVRPLATEAQPEEWGYYPNTIDYSEQLNEKLIRVFRGEDVINQPKMARRNYGTKEHPNLVPVSEHGEVVVGCTCEPTSTEIFHFKIRRGELTTCPCGYHFAGVPPEDVAWGKSEKYPIM